MNHAHVSIPHPSATAFRPSHLHRTRHAPKRRIEHVRDRDGTPIVRVELPCGAFAKTDAESFAALMGAGVSPNWTLNPNGPRSRWYVRVPEHGRRGNLATVARLIVQAPPGSVVHYRDGDHLNLRRDNLNVIGGASRRTDDAPHDADGAPEVAHV